MKTAVLVLMLSPLWALAQKIALLDRDLKEPMIEKEAVTPQTLSGKWFPVFTTDLDSIILLTETLLGHISNRDWNQKMAQPITAGHSRFHIREKGRGGDVFYSISLYTRANDIGAILPIITGPATTRQSTLQLEKFLNYVKNNRHLAGR